MQEGDIIPYSSAASQQPPPGDAKPQPADHAPAESVDRIREIIFGGQMRDYEHRFEKLEHRLNEEMREMQSALQQRIEALEGFVKREFEALNERLDAESATRTERLVALDQEMRKADSSLEQKTTALESQQTRLASSLRDLVLEQSKSLLTEIGHKHKMLTETLNQQENALREDLTDRRALADLFSELSIRLGMESDEKSDAESDD